MNLKEGDRVMYIGHTRCTPSGKHKLEPGFKGTVKRIDHLSALVAWDDVTDGIKIVIDGPCDSLRAYVTDLKPIIEEIVESDDLVCLYYLDAFRMMHNLFTQALETDLFSDAGKDDTRKELQFFRKMAISTAPNTMKVKVIKKIFEIEGKHE